MIYVFHHVSIRKTSCVSHITPQFLYIAVGANNFARIRHIIIPPRALTNSIPLRFCSFKINVRQAAAIIEGTITDARHAVMNCDARQPSAIIEGKRAYTRHAAANGYARQPGATIEGIIADARHAAANGYASQPSATTESI